MKLLTFLIYVATLYTPCLANTDVYEYSNPSPNWLAHLPSLRAALSPAADIYLPDAPEWGNVTEHISPGLIRPEYLASVVVGTERDVVESVGIPFWFMPR